VPVTRRGRLPVYEQIADDLRAQILDGTLEAGGQLPTEAELTDRYQVARATVRQALTSLVNEGLILSVRPRGHFVRERQRLNYRPQVEFDPRPPAVQLDAFMAQQADEGRDPSQTIEVAIVVPPPLVADRLAGEPGEPVVVRRRVRYLAGEPFNTNDSYFPLTMVQDSEIMRPADIGRGANQVLAEQGYAQVRAVDEFFVRMPTPEDARRLDLGPGTPVACHVCTGFTADDEPVRVVLNVLPGDRHVIVYDRVRPESPAGEEP
jgi:DNA-binding GntR family transcriptional regulator